MEGVTPPHETLHCNDGEVHTHVHVALGKVRSHIAILLLLYPTGFSFSMWQAVTYLVYHAMISKACNFDALYQS